MSSCCDRAQKTLHFFRRVAKSLPARCSSRSPTPSSSSSVYCRCLLSARPSGLGKKTCCPGCRTTTGSRDW